MYVIISLCFGKRLGVKPYCFMFPSGIRLCEECPCDIGRGIDLKGVQLGRVWLMEAGIVKDCKDEGVKCVSAFGSPGEGVILLCEFREGFCNVHVVWYKRSLITQDS